jgi:hypothetical protein
MAANLLADVVRDMQAFDQFTDFPAYCTDFLPAFNRKSRQTAK